MKLNTLKKINKIILLSMVGLSFALSGCSDGNSFLPPATGISFPKGAKSAITKKNILDMAKAYTPDGFEYVDVKINSIDNHYDLLRNPATSFESTYMIKATKDRFKVASRKNQIDDMGVQVVFVNKVISEGDILEVAGSGSYSIGFLLNEYSLSASPKLFGLHRDSSTMESLISNSSNKKSKQRMRVIELGSEDERAFLEEEKGIKEAIPETLLGLWNVHNTFFYSDEAGKYYIYSTLNKKWISYSYKLDDNWGFVPTPGNRAIISHISDNAFSMGNGTYKRLLSAEGSKLRENSIKECLPTNWSNLNRNNNNVTEFTFNDDGTYILTKSRVDPHTKTIVQSQSIENGTWKVLHASFLELLNMKGRLTYYYISNISGDEMTLAGDVYINKKYDLVKYTSPSNSNVIVKPARKPVTITPAPKPVTVAPSPKPVTVVKPARKPVTITPAPKPEPRKVIVTPSPRPEPRKVIVVPAPSDEN